MLERDECIGRRRRYPLRVGRIAANDSLDARVDDQTHTPAARMVRRVQYAVFEVEARAEYRVGDGVYSVFALLVQVEVATV